MPSLGEGGGWDLNEAPSQSQGTHTPSYLPQSQGREMLLKAEGAAGGGGWQPRPQAVCP